MFTASLINDPFSDPGVYVDFRYRREALLFDLGEVHHLPPRKLLKISHIFISHTHMDHFIGFDHLLRVSLGRDQHISLFGPPGFIKNVESKIGAYTWNLVENYTNDFDIIVTELHDNHKIVKQYHCQHAFRPEDITIRGVFDGTVVERDDFTVKCAHLDHRIPSIAFSLEEKQHLNIKRNALEALHLPIGQWLAEFKRQILRNEPDSSPVRVWWKNNDGHLDETSYSLGMLKEAIVKVTPGNKICYVADAIYSKENSEKIITLARDADILFIEAPFLHEDSDIASRKYHLTAQQAGTLARKAGVKNVSIFHFSPKYKGRGDELVGEMMKAFAG